VGYALHVPPLRQHVHTDDAAHPLARAPRLADRAHHLPEHRLGSLLGVEDFRIDLDRHPPCWIIVFGIAQQVVVADQVLIEPLCPLAVARHYQHDWTRLPLQQVLPKRLVPLLIRRLPTRVQRSNGSSAGIDVVFRRLGVPHIVPDVDVRLPTLRGIWQPHDLDETRLEGHFKDAKLIGVYLEGADLRGARLERALLSGAHLEHADLSGAHLENADLSEVHLENADLRGAHLEGAFLRGAHLEGANLTGASFDKTSHLNDAVLTGASFDQVTFDNTNLTVADWSLVDILGDEHAARERRGSGGQPKDRAQWLDGYKAAVRANRVLAVALQAQGLSEDAARFAYRAQLLQRRVYRLQSFRKLSSYLFSLLIAALAGYGYRLWRIAAAYALVLVAFATAYVATAIITASRAFPNVQGHHAGRSWHVRSTQKLTAPCHAVWLSRKHLLLRCRCRRLDDRPCR
jgi:hypothetical protein